MQDWVVEVIDRLGPLGIGVVMLAENVFPPIPSELIMPLAGYLSATGELSFVAAVIAGCIGSLLGATLWYAVGRLITPERLCGRIERHGAWLAMTTADVDHAVRWFRGHGRFSVLFGRLVPVIRTLISIPAGFSRMPPGEFLLLSAIGTAAWTSLLAFAGRILGQRYSAIEQYVGPVSSLVMGLIVITYIVRVVRIRRASV